MKLQGRLRVPGSDDIPALLALNNLHAQEVGTLSREDFEQLLALAFHVRMVGTADGFLIALEQGAVYGSPNYQWFSERLSRFVYVDRVIVAPHARKLGLGRLFYNDLIEVARAAGHTVLACEVNCDPPNPGSDAFHAALGFVEIGRAHIPERGKTVRYLIREL